MIQVQIGDTSRQDVDAQWINEQISRRQRAEGTVCVRVLIKTESANVALATADCPGSSGGPRPPNAEERHILDLWSRLGLDKDHFGPGQLVAFLKQVA